MLIFFRIMLVWKGIFLEERSGFFRQSDTSVIEEQLSDWEEPHELGAAF